MLRAGARGVASRLARGALKPCVPKPSASCSRGASSGAKRGGASSGKSSSPSAGRDKAAEPAKALPRERPESSIDAPWEGEAPLEGTKLRLVQFATMALIGSAALTVAPYAMAALSGHAVKLLAAQERFMVSAGVSRLGMMLAMGLPPSDLLGKGAAKEVVECFDRWADRDVGLASALLTVAQKLAVSPEGLEALREAGAEEVLRKREEIWKREGAEGWSVMDDLLKDLGKERTLAQATA